MRKPTNWTAIANTCPEFIANEWDVVLAVIAVIGLVFSCILSYRLKKEMKGSTFLFILSFIDILYCLLYICKYVLKSAALYYRSEILAGIATNSQIKLIEEYGNLFIPPLVFFIVFEKFLWTCTSETRQTWKIITVDIFKYRLIWATSIIAFAATVATSWNVMVSPIHFCSVFFYTSPHKILFLRVLADTVIPAVGLLLAPITFVFALITLCRISRVGEGERAENEEGINLTNIVAESPKLTTGKIKRSILCMLAVYFLFLVRGFCWYVYVSPHTSPILEGKETPESVSRQDDSKVTYPPGPTPLPLIGNMIEMFSYPPPGTDAFAAWAQKFGKIYTIWMGTEPTIVINGYKDLKETFVNDGESYVDKMIYKKLNTSLRGGDHGVIDTNGNTWKEHRRFALHTMRDFGLGKEAMEASIQLEVDKIEEELRAAEGKDVNMQEAFDMAIGNVINQFLFGHRFSDPTRFNELKRLLDLFFDFQGSLRVYIAYLIGWMPQFMVELLTPDVGEVRDGIFTFFKEQIDEHRKEIDFDAEESKDYVETFMKKQRKREAEGDQESFSDDQLRNMCFDMWVAGMHTTTNTMGFLTAIAVNNMDAQRKMQKELSEVVGDRVVTMKDKLNLPYTNAFINEAQRFTNLLPINLPHATTRDVNLAGYVIPKGTAVVHQISSVLSDPEVFPEPEKFKPERFLNSNGSLKKVEELVPFSIGKRVCLGEGLARMELFLFTANLFNRFEFAEGTNGLPSLEKTFSFISKAKDYTCRVTPRYSQ
ncbi:unnamed protein product [Caenorhabditis sp. 36 PRJEB53466]|nr:unnamed protein product [Caenorhabditis sp. 36 PRJEB53466]